MKLFAALAVMCAGLGIAATALSARADWVDDGLGHKASETERRAFVSGTHAGILWWARDHCIGSISEPHAQRLSIERGLDPTAFDLAARTSYGEMINLASETALKAPSSYGSGFFGNNVVCQVQEEQYGPHGTIWMGAWLPPNGQRTTAK
jgi:hypothetical protein